MTESTSVSSGSGFSSLSWFKKSSSPIVPIGNGTPKTATPTVTVTQSAPTKAQFNRSTGGTQPSFEVAVLDAHNRLRARHSAPALTLNPSISRYAQEWANVSDLAQAAVRGSVRSYRYCAITYQRCSEGSLGTRCERGDGSALLLPRYNQLSLSR